MNIFLVVALYITVSMTLLLCLFCSPKLKWLKMNSFQRTLNHAVIRTLPSPLLSCCYTTNQYIFYKRNCIFQVLFLVLFISGHVIYFTEALPILYTYSLDENHIFCPMLFAFLTLVSYLLTIMSDPGVVTARNKSKFQSVYAISGLQPLSKYCDPCDFPRPLRVMHCYTCEMCIFRRDHHCVWTNCCIGGLNHRYFMVFLVSIVCTCAHGTMGIFYSLFAYVTLHELWLSSYIDSYSQEAKPMDWSTLFDHLVHTFPRMTFLLSSLFVLTCVLTAYLVYHCFLASNNQTYIERQKMSKEKYANTVSPFSHQNVYRNLVEVFCPERLWRNNMWHYTKYD